MREKSKDLALTMIRLEVGITGHITVHRNDTVSVILACSQSPVYLDIKGLVRLTSALAHIEAKIGVIIERAISELRLHDEQPKHHYPPLDDVKPVHHLIIPESGTWIITMWHVNRDSIQRYAGACV